jgi:hypothetical protein
MPDLSSCRGQELDMALTDTDIELWNVLLTGLIKASVPPALSNYSGLTSVLKSFVLYIYASACFGIP